MNNNAENNRGLRDELENIVDIIAQFVIVIIIIIISSILILILSKTYIYIKSGVWEESICDLLHSTNFKENINCYSIGSNQEWINKIYTRAMMLRSPIIYLITIVISIVGVIWIGNLIYIEARRLYRNFIAARRAKSSKTFDIPMTAIDAYVREKLSKREEFIKLLDAGMKVERHDTEEDITFLPFHTAFRRKNFRDHEDYLPVNARRHPVTGRTPRAAAPILFHWKGDLHPLLSLCVFADNSIMIDTGRYGWEPVLIWDPDAAVDAVLRTIERIFADKEADRKYFEKLRAKDAEKVAEEDVRRRQEEEYVRSVEAERQKADIEAIARLRERKQR